jgi:putative endonuclease
MNSREIGNIAENKAIEFLENQKFIIIDRNFYTKFGEIDIIAKKDNVLHFIEVKSGKNFQSIYNITPTKMKRIIKSIEVYLKKYKLQNPYQIDAITIDNGKLEFIKNISFF